MVVGISAHTGVRLAEVGFLLMGIAGVWLAASSVPQLKISGARSVVAGVLLAIGSLLIIIAIHWGHFGWFT